MKQPFCTPAQALRRVLDAAAALPVPATERVPLDDACGRIAARDLCARMDQPPFDRSPLDGYALHSADTAGAGEETPVTLPVVMKLYAGDAPAAVLPAGCAARIMTGAPLPPGADCVLMQELTDGGEEQVRIYAQLQPNANVVFRGEDIAAGAPIAAAGTVLTPAHIGVLAGQGIPDAEVFRPLTVGVLATGSELLEAGEAWAPGKIYDANGIQNAARLRQLGFAVERPGGTFYIFPKALEEDANAFCQKAREFDLLLVPGSGFGAPGHFRLAYCVQTDMIERALPKFKALADSYRG